MKAYDGAGLRERRLLKGFSQDELANRCQVDVRTIRNAERGRNVPRPFTQRLIAQVLGCNPEDLLLSGEAARPAAANSESPGAAASEMSRPASLLAIRQLHDPPSTFVGRDSELAALQEGLRQGVRALSISGLGGAGKTALACALAERVTAQYPDGQLHIDLRGSQEPARPADAMRHVLWSLEPDAPVIEDDVRLAAAYRSALRGRRVLLLFDDAASSEQLEPLVPPPPGCLALITSRRTIVREGMSSLLLSALHRESARELLATLAPMASDLSERLSDLSSGLPLALVLLARALAQPDVAPDELIEAFERARTQGDGLGPLGGIEAPLRQVYARLDPRLGACFALLFVLGQSFDRHAVAAIWDCDEAEAADDLRELLRWHLVEHVAGRGEQARYRLHDLVRDFAAAQVTPEQRERARRQHAIHYLGVLERVDRSFCEDGIGQLEALGELDREWGHIERAHAWCVEQRAHDARAAELQSCLPGAHILDVRQPARARLEWCQRALEHVAPDDFVRRAALLERVGTAQRELGRFAAAIGCYQESLALAAGAGRCELETHALLGLGVTTYYAGEPRNAVPWLERSRARARESGDGRAEQRALRGLGIAWCLSGELRRAEQIQNDALQLACRRSDRVAEAQSRLALGFVLRQLGHPDAACVECDRALELATQADAKLDALHAKIFLSFARSDLGQLAPARALADECVSGARNLGDARTLALALGATAFAAAPAGDLSHAEASAAGMLHAAQLMGDVWLEGWACAICAHVCIAADKVDQAAELLEDWLTCARQLHDRHGEAYASWELAQIHRTRGRPQLALAAMQACLTYEEEMDHAWLARHRAEAEGLSRELRTSEPTREARDEGQHEGDPGEERDHG